MMRLVLALLLLAPLANGEGDGGEPLLVGIDSAFPPHQWIDDEGVAQGFDVELFRAVAAEAGLDYEIRGGPWNEIRGQLERSELDLALGVVRTPERDKLLDFSISTARVAHTIFVPMESKISTLDELEGLVVAVARGTVIDDRLGDRVPTAVPLRTETSLEALERVVTGEAQAAILLDSQGLYFIREHRLEGVRSVGRPITHVKYRMAVPSDRSDLLAGLNDGLIQVRESGAHDDLQDQWFGVLQPTGLLDGRSGRILLVTTAATALLLLAAVIWSRTLQNRVEARTQELRSSEQAALELERQLLQSQKMEALGRLAGGVTHDFNNVLTTIIGNASLAFDEAQPGGRLARALDSIRRAGQAGADLTRQLLAFARGDSAEPREVNWNSVVVDSRDMLQRLIGSRISVRFEPRPDLWDVWLDPGQALQIVMNLVINARDAIAGSGTITIEAVNVQDQKEASVRLSVGDDGEGMDAATRERIFEPFFTTKPISRGSGLGLATVYGIAERCGGRVDVSSEAGKGSRFDVTLPRAPALDAAASGAVLAPIAGKATALLVEDDPGVRDLGAILLRSLGHEVLEAGDAEQAIVLARDHGRVGLLVTDLDLPGASGLSLVRELLAAFPNTAVLLLSGYVGELGLPAGTRVAYLPKPFDVEEMAAALAILKDRPR